jgi:hypothetical protein
MTRHSPMSFGSLRKWSYGLDGFDQGRGDTSGSPTSLVWIRTFPMGASAKILEKDVLIAPPARTISTAHIFADNSRPL